MVHILSCIGLRVQVVKFANLYLSVRERPERQSIIMLKAHYLLGLAAYGGDGGKSPLENRRGVPPLEKNFILSNHK